jgi:ABC-type branched-subunit amino acid transport system substrate-binding protein
VAAGIIAFGGGGSPPISASMRASRYRRWRKRSRLKASAVKVQTAGANMKTSGHRGLLAAAAVFLAIGLGAKPAKADDTIKIGILHSLSGTMAISETILKDLMLMEVADINAKGGLLGKKIEPVVVDPASNWPLFAEKARELLTKDKVAAVFGCWTSVSRKSVLPVFEELNGLLFYPLEYEARKRPTTSSTEAPSPTTRLSPLSSI